MARKVQLTQGCYAIVDDEDYERISLFNWYAEKSRKKIYAVRKSGNKTIRMHRFIMEPPTGYAVDHINGNGLDNRKINLRICKQTQNCQNRKPNRNSFSKYKGVSYFCKKWVSMIRINGKLKYLGRHETEIEAAVAYNEKAKEYHGEFAHINNIPSNALSTS
jgi:hypothetical protein